MLKPAQDELPDGSPNWLLEHTCDGEGQFDADPHRIAWNMETGFVRLERHREKWTWHAEDGHLTLSISRATMRVKSWAWSSVKPVLVVELRSATRRFRLVGTVHSDDVVSGLPWTSVDTEHPLVAIEPLMNMTRALICHGDEWVRVAPWTPESTEEPVQLRATGEPPVVLDGEALDGEGGATPSAATPEYATFTEVLFSLHKRFTTWSLLLACFGTALGFFGLKVSYDETRWIKESRVAMARVDQIEDRAFGSEVKYTFILRDHDTGHITAGSAPVEHLYKTVRGKGVVKDRDDYKVGSVIAIDYDPSTPSVSRPRAESRYNYIFLLLAASALVWYGVWRMLRRNFRV